MDPITAAALAALAGSLGSEAGRQVWQGLTALVRRPFGGASAQGTQDDGTLQVSSGELEAAALERDPANPMHAQALATCLGVRAALDGEFRGLLNEWWQQAQAISLRGDVQNSISGGTQNGPVLQGRDFSNLTFNMTRTRTDR
ncbi:hypothetical protein [Streptomyces collinus]|uniref:Uncharacterized protein n=1 Tax=Streptomyces collinus (strain DSM 40733 / Tue 365) TaxID=1214242 RepID=S5VB14_STRC3|nr:hypothetical protein [Streptomyces collinus]AGS72314.1 hypothetical protein B446_27530 [Streptomyces collinus Tu 365]UJA10970.1 hypothetical protein HGI10_49450 [Streptomyces collinus]UJA14166.1 hypothetical protein HGI09_14670 [Streptomyces collinus]